jgi:hypothetical protein
VQAQSLENLEVVKRRTSTSSSNILQQNETTRGEDVAVHLGGIDASVIAGEWGTERKISLWFPRG